MSNAAFKANYAKVLKKAGDKVDLVVRKSALSLQRSMVMKSPVDTGRFKSNWQCGIGAVNSINTSPENSDALGRTEAVLNGWGIGQQIWLTNAMPYARRLEYGWSKQAAGGMVRLTVANFKKIIKKEADAIK